MAHAQRAVADAAADADQLDIGVGVSAVHLGLLVASGRNKACRRESERFLANLGQPCSDTDQVLLGDTGLDGLFRIFFEERCHGGGTSGVAAERDNVFVLLSMLHENFTDDLSVRNLIHCGLPPPFL